MTTFSATRVQPTSQKPLRATARGTKAKHLNKSSTNTHKGAASKSSDAPQFAEQQAPSRGAAVDFANLHTFYEDELEDERQNEWETVGVETHQSEDLLSERKTVELEKFDDDCVQEAPVEEMRDVPQACEQKQIMDNEAQEEMAEEMQPLNVQSTVNLAESQLQESETEPSAALPAAPTKMPNVTPAAESFIATLEEALSAGNGELLSELTFDAECEGLADQIDLTWYEQQAAKLILAQQQNN